MPRHSRPSPGRHDLVLDAGAIDTALAEVVPDARDRAFVLRCILEEGPRHHRVASWALLQMLAAVLAELDDTSSSAPRPAEAGGGTRPAEAGGGAPRARDSAAEPLAMRLPPHVAASSDAPEFPIGMPTYLLRNVMGKEEADLALESLGDGPPHHALANAAMAWLLQAIYERVRRSPPSTKEQDER